MQNSPIGMLNSLSTAKYVECHTFHLKEQVRKVDSVSSQKSLFQRFNFFLIVISLNLLCAWYTMAQGEQNRTPLSASLTKGSVIFAPLTV